MNAEKTLSNDASGYGNSPQSLHRIESWPHVVRLCGGRVPGLWGQGHRHDLRGGIQPLDEDRQVSSAATDFEDSLPWVDACLIDELSVRRLHAQDLGERVIEREKPIFSRGWEIGLPDCVHLGLFSYNA